MQRTFHKHLTDPYARSDLQHQPSAHARTDSLHAAHRLPTLFLSDSLLRTSTLQAARWIPVPCRRPLAVYSIRFPSHHFLFLVI